MPHFDCERERGQDFQVGDYCKELGVLRELADKDHRECRAFSASRVATRV